MPSWVSWVPSWPLFAPSWASWASSWPFWVPSLPCWVPSSLSCSDSCTLTSLSWLCQAPSWLSWASNTASSAEERLTHCRLHKQRFFIGCSWFSRRWASAWAALGAPSWPCWVPGWPCWVPSWPCWAPGLPQVGAQHVQTGPWHDLTGPQPNLLINCTHKQFLYVQFVLLHEQIWIILTYCKYVPKVVCMYKLLVNDVDNGDDDDDDDDDDDETIIISN